MPSRVGFRERHCESCADAGRILETISIVITANVKATSLLFRFNIPSNTFHHCNSFHDHDDYSSDLR